MHMTARMYEVDPWKHQNSIMEACKQQNMQAAEAYASSRTMVACKQQNYGSMEAAEPWKQQNH